MYSYSRHQWLRATADGSGEFVGARMMFLSLLDIPGPKETVLRPQNLSRSHSQPFKLSRSQTPNILDLSTLKKNALI